MTGVGKRGNYAHGQLGGRDFLSSEENLSYIEKAVGADRVREGVTLALPSFGMWHERGLAVSFSPAHLQCDCVWLGLLFLTFLLSLTWLYIGLILLNDLHNFNEFVMDQPSSSAYLSTYAPPCAPRCSAPTISPYLTSQVHLSCYPASL